MEAGVFALPRRFTVENTDQIFLTRTPVATTLFGILNMGDAPFDGISAGKFSGNAFGTILAMNWSSNTGGNFVDFQTAGVSKFRVQSDGTVTMPSGVNLVSSQMATPGTSLQLIQANNTTSANAFIARADSATYPTARGINASSGQQSWFTINGSILQTGSAGYTVLTINNYEISTGSGNKLLVDVQQNSVSKFSIDPSGNTTSAGQVNDATGIGSAARLYEYYFYS